MTDTLKNVTIASNGNSDSAYISNDGSYIAFESTATNLVSGDTTTVPRDMFRYNIITDTFDRLVDSVSM